MSAVQPAPRPRARWAIASALALVLVAAALVVVGDPAALAARGGAYLAGRVDVLRGQAVFIAGIASVVALEVVLMGYAGSSLSRLVRPTRSTWIDIACFVLMRLGLYGLLTWMFTLSLAASLPKYLGAATPAGALGFGHPLVQYAWLIVAVDFVRYVMHYLQHRVPFWWQAHAFHHCATELNVITTSRAHPVDHGLQLVFLAVPVALLGGTMLDFLAINFVLALHAGVTHSMLPWTFGWLGRWVLVSPVAHRIHHSDLPEHHDRNLGSVFIIWDRIFGTWYAGPVVNQTVGIAGNDYNRRGLLADFVTCGLRTYAAALAPVVRPVARRMPGGLRARWRLTPPGR